MICSFLCQDQDPEHCVQRFQQRAGAYKLEGVSKSNLAKLQKLQDSLQEQKEVIDQLASGKILARISSRPGQCGRADGYILEDEELAFYHKKINQKKK